jgi:hypothetical protein
MYFSVSFTVAPPHQPGAGAKGAIALRLQKFTTALSTKPARYNRNNQ